MKGKVVSKTGPDRKITLDIEGNRITITAHWKWMRAGYQRKQKEQESILLTRAEWDACVAAVAEVTQ